MLSLITPMLTVIGGFVVILLIVIAFVTFYDWTRDILRYRKWLVVKGIDKQLWEVDSVEPEQIVGDSVYRLVTVKGKMKVL